MMQNVVQNIEQVSKDVVNTVHTAMPATITAYDSSKGLCSVQPQGTFYQGSTAIDYPVISGVPLVVSSSKTVGIYFPINVGDDVLLVISEQSLTAWLTGVKASNSNEKFELTNAIAIAGLQKVALAGQNEANSKNAVIAQAGGVKLTVSSGGVEIQGSLKVSGGITAGGNVVAPNID